MCSYNSVNGHFACENPTLLTDILRHQWGFTGFVVSLGAAGFLGWLGALLPLTMGVALTALEFLVAAVQAYVFAVLTSMYLNDAVHPSH